MIALALVLLLLVGGGARLALGQETVGAAADGGFANALRSPTPTTPPTTREPDSFANALRSPPTPTTSLDPETRARLEAFSSSAAAAAAAAATSTGAAAGATGPPEQQQHRAQLLLNKLRSARAAADAKLQANGGALLDGMAALRERLGARGKLRLVEAMQKARGAKCKAGSFSGPKETAAKITGPGARLAITGPLCTVQRKATPLQITLPVACTGPGIVLRESPPIFAASTVAPAKATTRECKAERKWGPEGAAEVVLFDPRVLAPLDVGGGAPSALPPLQLPPLEAWQRGVVDVAEAVKGLGALLLSNTTVKGEGWGEGASFESWAQKRGGQAEAVRGKFEEVRRVLEGLGGGVEVAAASEAAAATSEAALARREAEKQLRVLAAEYLQERLAERLEDDEEGQEEDEGEDAAASSSPSEEAGSALRAAFARLARLAVADEAAPLGLVES
jgi:hypothetical protein